MKATRLKHLEELSQQLGIDLQPVPASSSLGSRAHRVRLLEYARDTGCVISPIGWQYYLDSYAMFGVCPCDSARKACPCEEAASDISATGHCLCKLLWRDYDAYLEEG